MSHPNQQSNQRTKRDPTRSGEAGGASGTVGKSLDGTLGAVVKEITRLHGEIFNAARTTLTKAIRIGELLTRVRASRNGNWLKWIADNLPFSHDSALHYIRCYEQRDDPRLRNVRNLSDAYGLLCAPKTTRTQRQSANGHTHNVSPPIPDDNQTPVAPTSAERPQPQRRHKSQKKIMAE